ncbi:OsmC family protein [Arthrobacter sp. zg-ZUI100]|uniref:OsmC family protein n=1 Tax=Arthrobacter jiangjiafuii TaxID=2817475 RepID=A0A975M301_9MICC|nr:OsmC family protein [Arthrobacter jiangjiafuii]MBP3035994.1 OsmC family protein [Arthrobacter jiangjiafuii]MBP3043504.1 OsmC family protein [Arthrobacter jiangjiafuii]QWC09023.1 OsmC family protein [Arthrobacter jiangjiafuii]
MVKDLSEHRYAINLEWTGNRGSGTASYRGYGRDHIVRADGLPDLAGTADPTFHGDRDRWNPEQLLLTALAQCHMLSYLHVAVKNGITVLAYGDAAEGTMRLNRDGSGEFTGALLRPRVTIAAGNSAAVAEELHTEANRLCFIARSVNFPVLHKPEITVEIS